MAPASHGAQTCSPWKPGCLDPLSPGGTHRVQFPGPICPGRLRDDISAQLGDWTSLRITSVLLRAVPSWGRACLAEASPWDSVLLWSCTLAATSGCQGHKVCPVCKTLMENICLLTAWGGDVRTWGTGGSGLISLGGHLC